MIHGSLNWVIGHNVTSACNIKHTGRNALAISDGDAHITMINRGFHSFITAEGFSCPSICASTVEVVDEQPASTKSNYVPWKQLKRIVYRLHRHVCGHVKFPDMRTILVRNGMWRLHAQVYVVQTVNECVNCVSYATTPPNRRVSLSSLDSESNNVICIDHFFLGDHTLFHVMDTASDTAHHYNAAARV